MSPGSLSGVCFATGLSSRDLVALCHIAHSANIDAKKPEEKKGKQQKEPSAMAFQPCQGRSELVLVLAVGELGYNRRSWLFTRRRLRAAGVTATKVTLCNTTRPRLQCSSSSSSILQRQVVLQCDDSSRRKSSSEGGRIMASSTVHLETNNM